MERSRAAPMPRPASDPAPIELEIAPSESDLAVQRGDHLRPKQLIDSIATFVGLCRPDGTVVEANRAALEASGLNPAEVIGRPLWETPWLAWDVQASRRMRAAVERAGAGEPSRHDVQVMTASGILTVDFSIVPVIEDGVVIALVPSGTDVTQRRRSADQTTGLAALGRRLNGASTVAEVAETIRAHTAAAIGSRHATLALLDAGDDVIRLLQSPTLPEHIAREFHTMSVDSPHNIATCMRTGATVVIADPLTLADVDGSPEELARMQEGRAAAGVSVSAATPLLGADGTVMGALAAGWPRVDDLDGERLARMETVAELCAQAIERARLTDAYVVAAERGQALSTLAAELASAVTVEEVWDAVGRGAPRVVGAASASLGLLVADGSMLDVRYPDDVSARLAGLPTRQPVSAARPQADAARTGHPVFLSTVAEHEDHYPGLLAGLYGSEPVRVMASATLPLRDNADRVVGTLALGWTTTVTFDPVLRSTLETMAEVCGQTLERARLHAAEHELVEGLQRRLLRPVPVVPGLATHATYRAAQTSVGIGGDFHDGLVLPGGRLAVVVGDVAGHGMEAAADMAQLRTLLSTLLAAGVPLERLFAQAEAALDRVATLSLATAAAAILDPAEQTLTYLHAGHPPLLLRTPDGAAAPLAGARGGLLGADIAGDRPVTPVTVPFAPGSVLVGYTDGLVEVRGVPLNDGIAALAAATADAARADPHLDADRIGGFVLNRCIGGRQLTDDVALLVVTYPPPPRRDHAMSG